MTGANKDINCLIVSSRVRLARNLEGLPFKTVKRGAYDAVAETVRNKNKGYMISKIQELTPDMSQMLFEQHLISKELLDNKSNSAIVFKGDYSVCVMLGEEDHIRIQSIRTGFDLITAFNESKKIADDIAESHDVAFRQDLGYLTSCPTNLGCGMRASVMMFLPALTLTGQIEPIMAHLEEGRITVRGVYGEGSEAGGNMYQISNQACLGMSEQQIVENVAAVTIEIAKAELALQERLYTESPDEITDQVLRSWGVLTNAHMISSAEAVDHLALLKLGSCLGIIKFRDEKILDKMFFEVQPATLITRDNRADSVRERDKIRAQKVAGILRAARIK